MGFDILQRVRSIKLSKNANDTVDLPDDFVSLVKIGVVGDDGLVYVLGQTVTSTSLRSTRRAVAFWSTATVMVCTTGSMLRALVVGQEI